MMLRLQDIGPEGSEVELLLEKDWLGEVVGEAGTVDFRVNGDQSICVAASRAGLQVRLRCSFGLKLVADCAGCLEDFPLDVPVGFDLLLKPQPAQAVVEPGEKELSAEDLEEHFYQGDELDLLEVVREQIILALPLYPRCRPDCRGLCPRCGANLNRENCECKLEQADSPWSVLRNLADK